MNGFLFALLALAVSALAVSCVLDGGDDDDDATAQVTPTDGSSGSNLQSAVPVSADLLCSGNVEPGYLPWLQTDQGIEESDHFRQEGQEVITWREDPQADESDGVVLIVDMAPRPEDAEPVNLFVDGVPAGFDLNAFKGGHLIWQLEREGCGAVVLTLDMDLPRDELLAELRLIALSLREVD